MKKIMAGVLLVLTFSILPATNHYIRPGATGTGSDWANALGALPSRLTRGDTYYLADGKYGNYEFNDKESGTLFIYIKKALWNYKLLILLPLAVLSYFAKPLIKKIVSFNIFQSEYIPFISFIPAIILVFSKINLFGFLLNLGVDNYYISSITINNYYPFKAPSIICN